MIDDLFNGCKTCCPDCEGELKGRRITYHVTWQEEIFSFDEVQARVCEQCGFAWLSASVLQEIERILDERPDPSKMRSVGVYTLEAVA